MRTIWPAKVLGPSVEVILVCMAGADTKFVVGRTRKWLDAKADTIPRRKVTSTADVVRAIEAAITHLICSNSIMQWVDEGRYL